MGWEVLSVDNYYTGARANIAQHLGNKNFEAIRHDVTKEFNAEVDLVLNFACPASPVHYQHNPIKTVKTNVLGTMHLLGLAKRVGARFLQASTSEVYGNPEQHPQKESYLGNVNPIGVRSCYDEGKRMAETLTMDYHRVHRVDVRIVRIFNTYGPRMALNDGRAVSNFFTQALSNKPIVIYGDGSQTRSFCFIDDLVEGIVRAASLEVGPQPINLGNSVEFRISQLAELVQEAAQTNVPVVHKELPADDPKVRQPDISLAKKLLQWEPKTSLKEGLLKTAPYFRAQIAHESAFN
jgi:UDP-glucuronate decarboxylase